MSLEAVRSGPLSLVQDAGRPGLAAIGVSPSGAFDRTAFTRGATLVGNDPGLHAAIEVTLGGLSVRAVAPVTVALTGAECPATVDGRVVAWDRPFLLGAGELLAFGLPRTDLRSYLSVAGGIDVPPVLGSRSTDLLSGLGPPRLAAGMVLPVGRTAVPEELASAANEGHEGPPPAPTVPEELREERPSRRAASQAQQRSSGSTKRYEGPPPRELELLPGPRTDWLADPDSLATTWTVSPDSNRVGIRLKGTVLERSPSRVGAELPSEPLVRGAVQLPPSGQPVIFGPDHPTTGGYPVVAVLTEQSSDRLAQCRPGDIVRLAWALRDATVAPLP